MRQAVHSLPREFWSSDTTRPRTGELRLSAGRTRDRGVGLGRQGLNPGLPDSLHSPSSAHMIPGGERLRRPEGWNLPRAWAQVQSQL